MSIAFRFQFFSHFERSDRNKFPFLLHIFYLVSAEHLGLIANYFVLLVVNKMYRLYKIDIFLLTLITMDGRFSFSALRRQSVALNRVHCLENWVVQW